MLRRRRPLMRAAVGTAVVAGTATAVAGGVRRRQNRRYQQQADAEAYEQQAYAPEPAYAPAPPPPAPVAPALSSVEQLTQLAGLHEQGVLTDAEFEAEKAKILAG